MSVTHYVPDRSRRGRYQQALSLTAPAVPGEQRRTGTPNIPEAAIQKSILAYLDVHPRVAIAYRSNTGAGQFTRKDGSLGRFVKFGFKGLPDITGMLNDGRALYIEVKSASGKLNDYQREFLRQVNLRGGVAFVAHSIDDVDHYLEKETTP
jgi:hypothetical protein